MSPLPPPGRPLMRFSPQRPALAPPAWLHPSLRLLSSHLVVALVALVAIGGATRVMEAGLACPDWPLCYGTLLPARQMNLQVFLEWFHRLDAFLVGIALLVLNGLALGYRRSLPRWLPPFAVATLLLVAVQGGLGALTVTGLLAAPTVTAHLMTALLLVALLSAIAQALPATDAAVTGSRTVQPLTATAAPHQAPQSLPLWWWLLLAAAAALLLIQCGLGGTMASQWAADRCFSSGEGCRWLWLHRLGAWPAALAPPLLALASLALPSGLRGLRPLALAAALLVLLQVALGVSTLRLQLAVPVVTVAHQLVAALLVALVAALVGRSSCFVSSSSSAPLP